MKFRALKAKELTMLAMLTALNVVMAEILKFRIIPGTLELSFGFIPIAITGMLFGPIASITVAVIADVIGAAIFSGGSFYLGYTLSALCTGLFYGLLLHKEPMKLWRILLAQALVSIICYAGLNTLWAYLMGYGKATGYIITRLVVNVVAYPIYTFVLYLLLKYRKTFERAVK
ncbi:MAG: folate family ECF transporter S component [Clostridiales bacterium]|nr:folate family ECF transporter S component [Clostridiales bacterium]